MKEKSDESPVAHGLQLETHMSHLPKKDKKQDGTRPSENGETSQEKEKIGAAIGTPAGVEQQQKEDSTFDVNKQD